MRQVLKRVAYGWSADSVRTTTLLLDPYRTNCADQIVGESADVSFDGRHVECERWLNIKLETG